MEIHVTELEAEFRVAKSYFTLLPRMTRAWLEKYFTPSLNFGENSKIFVNL
jgi:hypothetical protein